VTDYPDGTYSYVANANAVGSDSFVYSVTDSEQLPTAAATTTGTVNIDFLAVAPSPTPTQPGETPTPTVPGETPSVTVTPTSPGSTVVPGDPDPTTTSTAPDSDPGPDPAGDPPITTLPSTGSGDSGSTSTLIALILAAAILLGLATFPLRRHRA
jgi:LPXTG-motif cell wall-anchored protein